MQTNRKFGKLVNGSIVYAPSILTTRTEINTLPNADDYAAQGWLAVNDEPPAAPEGQYAAPTGFEERDGAIYRTYELKPVEAVPRTFSKLKLLMACKAEEIDLIGWVKELGYYDMWLAAQDLSEGYDGFTDLITLANDRFGADKVATVLAAAEV